MSIATKQVLLKDTEKRLGEYFTVNDVNRIMEVLTEILSAYEVEQVVDTSTDSESEEFLKAFLDAKRIEGKSEKTIKRYEYVIKRMYDAIKVPIRKISVFHLRSYFTAEKQRGVSDSTLDGTRQIFSAYFGWLQKEGLLTQNPTINLNTIKSVKKVRKPYSAVDIEKLKECCECDRDKAIIAVMLSTGCRISEICGMNRDDVNLVTHEILVLGKGNKERTVFIDDVTVMLIKRYLDSRHDDHEALFIGKRRTRFTPSGIQKMLNKVAELADVDNAHPHRFRRTLATNLIDHGMPIQEVASILGHEKLDTTMKYVYINKSNIKNSYNKYVG